MTSMRSTGKWSHWQHSSRAKMKHHDTSNKKRSIICHRTTTRCDAKTADVIPLFSTKDDSNKLQLKTTASWRALSGEQSQCRSAKASFRHHPHTCLRVQNVTCVVQRVGSGNVAAPNASSDTTKNIDLATTKNIDHLVACVDKDARGQHINDISMTRGALMDDPVEPSLEGNDRAPSATSTHATWR